MRDHHLHLLVCPSCQHTLGLEATIRSADGRVETGSLRCEGCENTYPIVRFIPRFVSSYNYASNFGLEWTRHARTQYDSETGTSISRDRFFGETGWPQTMNGEVMLEAGSGTGRFTEIAAGTGATVVSFDYSNAVDANYASNGNRANVLIVQADIYQMPFVSGRFDRVLCIGVVQHTPDVRRAFGALSRVVKPGGSLVVDIYRKSLFTTWLHTKYPLRLITRKKDPEALYRWTHRWVDLMWPVASLLRRIPRVGPSLNWRLMVPDYTSLGLEGAVLNEWAYLDAFDMLSPHFDFPQTAATLRRWHEEENLKEVEVLHGHNGVYCRSRTAV